MKKENHLMFGIAGLLAVVLGLFGLIVVFLPSDSEGNTYVKPQFTNYSTAFNTTFDGHQYIWPNNQKIIVQVYRGGCESCENARKTVTYDLSKHNDDPITYLQIPYDSVTGNNLLKQYSAKGVPLLLGFYPTTRKTKIINTANDKSVKQLIDWLAN